MDHQEVQELLPWHVNDTLGDAERAGVEAHLKRCSSCRRELEELRGLKSILTQALDEAAEGKEALLEGTLSRLRPRGAHKPERYRWALPLPLGRPALAFSLIALVSLALGVVVGLQLAVHMPVIGDLPRPGERASPITEAYFAIPREILSQGTLALFIGSQEMAEEAFTLERQDDGTLLLSSRIQAGELAAVQRLVLTEIFEPLSYSLQGPLVLGGRRAEAQINLKDSRATLTVCCRRTSEGEQLQRRIVTLEANPLIYDFSVPSHFVLLYLAIRERLQDGSAWDGLRFTALTPQALRAEPLAIEAAEPSYLKPKGGEGVISVTHYLLRFGEGEGLSVELYAQDSERTLLAVQIPAQPRLASSEAVVIFRRDLYPQGFTFEEGTR